MRMKKRIFLLILPVAFCLLVSIKPSPSYAGTDLFSEESEPADKLKLHYTLDVKSPKEHLFEVRIRVSGIRGSNVDFAIPAWSPGRYVIFDFTKNVQEFTASDLSGGLLHWYKLDKQTWRVDCRGVETLDVVYKVFANDLSGTFSQLDETHANYNGASIFMYVVDHKQDRIDLTVDKPAAWRLINGAADDVDEAEFHFDNYDMLIDTPTEMGDFQFDTFQVDGRTYRVALHSYSQSVDRDRLVDNLKRIVEAETRLFGTPDFKHYTFILHLVPYGSATDGMEHLNSTQVIENGFDELLETISHEFFHVWNVKRIR